VLIGEFNHNLDNKGRVIVPSRFREVLQDRFIITYGLDHSLFVYPLEEWSALGKKLRSMPFTKAEARAFQRLFFSGAADVEIDKQGRILIPPLLREHAKLNKEIVFIGVSNRAEIWSRENWNEYSNQVSLSYEQIAEKMIDFEF